MVPFSPNDEEYSIHLEVERKSDAGFGCNMGILVGGRQAVVDMDGSSNIGWALGHIDGHSMHDSRNPTTSLGKRFTVGAVVLVDIRVTGRSVHVLVDGNTVVNWTGLPEQLSVWDKIAPRLTSRNQLFFFSQSEFVIHKMELATAD